MLMLGNLLRECLVVTKLAETASNTLLNIVTMVLTVQSAPRWQQEPS